LLSITTSMRAGIQANRTFSQRYRADIPHSIETSINDSFREHVLLTMTATSDETAPSK
jgi:hypothetical protein